MYELTLFYLCIIAFCRDNCLLLRLNNLGGCLTCLAGFTGAPECCECDTTGNATYAFYKTPNGECKRECLAQMTAKDLYHDSSYTELLQLSARTTVLQVLVLDVIHVRLGLCLHLSVASVSLVVKK